MRQIDTCIQVEQFGIARLGDTRTRAGLLPGRAPGLARRTADGHGVALDTRFEAICVTPLRFFSLCNLQGLWIFLTLLSVLLTVVHGLDLPQMSPLDFVGACMWAVGYFLEVTADLQKTRFRQDARNKGKFIQSGLWRYSRHPNYLGEMMMWVGVYLAAAHALPNPALQALAALCPFFVVFLLTLVSGIPLLEKQGDERWGHTETYQTYKARTVFFPPRSTTTAA